MSSASRYWREAASLMLAARIKPPRPLQGHKKHGQDPGQFDYNILLLRRSDKSRFMPGRYVFPGGTLSAADYSNEWDGIFRSVVARGVEDVHRSLQIDGSRPPMLVRNFGTLISTDVAFRICAVRETFEEGGVLLARNKLHDGQDQALLYEHEDLRKWRSKVQDDAAEFPAMCRHLGVVPDIWALREWGNWLTPILEKLSQPPKKARRFDTIFYFCCLDEIPHTQHDDTEVTEAQWLDPLTIVHPESGIFIGGPQQFEIGRLCRFGNLERLAEYARQREPLGTGRVFNIIVNCADGYVVLLEGDDMYPAKPDLEGHHGMLTDKRRVAELRQGCTNLHRCEYDFANYICNIELPYGLTKPVSVKDLTVSQPPKL